MGKAKSEVTMEDSVVDDPQKTEEGANTSLVLLPPWAIEVASRWRKHNFNDLQVEVRHWSCDQSRVRVAEGPAAARAGNDPSSRSSHWDRSRGTFANATFRRDHGHFRVVPREVSRSYVVEQCQIVACRQTAGGKRRLVEALIGRLQTATADLKKPAFALDDVDLDRLLLELRTLGRELASRTQHSADGSIRAHGGGRLVPG